MKGGSGGIRQELYGCAEKDKGAGRGTRGTGYVVRGWVEKVERREGGCLEAGGI